MIMLAHYICSRKTGETRRLFSRCQATNNTARLLMLLMQPLKRNRFEKKAASFLCKYNRGLMRVSLQLPCLYSMISNPGHSLARITDM